MRDEIMEVKREIEEVKEKSFAMELISDYKKQNKRQFIVILVILTMWFASIGLFIYYINTTGYEETITETAETDDGGNACVGDNCNNGVINGKGK
jgi:hypothetical protein